MLIFIAVWSNCLRRKLLKVGAAESSLRQGGYHLELGSALVSPLPKRAFRRAIGPGFGMQREPPDRKCRVFTSNGRDG